MEKIKVIKQGEDKPIEEVKELEPMKEQVEQTKKMKKGLPRIYLLDDEKDSVRVIQEYKYKDSHGKEHYIDGVDYKLTDIMFSILNPDNTREVLWTTIFVYLKPKKLFRPLPIENYNQKITIFDGIGHFIVYDQTVEIHGGESFIIEPMTLCYLLNYTHDKELVFSIDFEGELDYSRVVGK